jgi:RHS repeat-associated protein
VLANNIKYAYDTADHLIGEYKQDGTPIREYIWLGALPVAVIDTNTDGTTTAYAIETDHLGTPRLLTDATGQARWRWTSPPFGDVPPDDDPTGLAPVTFNLRFPGQYYDKESGLSYNWHRVYDAETGRYVQSDPIGLDGGWNTYSYALNSPLRYIDSSGLDVEVGVRKFYPIPVPYARHCFLRFNGNNTDTLSFDNKGVHPDPNPDTAEYSKTNGQENDECVRKEMNKCQASDYDFTDFNCCKCASNALNACGLKNAGRWPNYPYDASNPPYSPDPRN